MSFTCKAPLKRSFTVNDARNGSFVSKLMAVHEAIRHNCTKHFPNDRYASQVLILEDFGWATEQCDWTDKEGFFVEYRIAPLDSGRVGRSNLVQDFENELKKGIFYGDPNPLIIRNPGWETGSARVQLFWHLDTNSIGD